MRSASAAVATFHTSPLLLRPLANLAQRFDTLSFTRHCSGDSKPGDDTHATYFPRLSAPINPFQTRLEAAEVSQAEAGLVSGSWVQLYQSPMQFFLSQYIHQPLASLRSALLRPLVDRVSTMAEKMVQNEVEGSFDKAEFLEGARAAVTSVTEMLGAGDWAGLRAVCSERLVDGMEAASAQLRDQHGLRLVSMAVPHIYYLNLATINLWSVDHVARFDSRWPAEASPSTSHSFLVAAVRVVADFESHYAPSTSATTGGKELGNQAKAGGSAGEGSDPTSTSSNSSSGSREGGNDPWSLWLSSVVGKGPVPRIHNGILSALLHYSVVGTSTALQPFTTTIEVLVHQDYFFAAARSPKAILILRGAR
ncbi:hypothetical protein QJQ45_020641 [Haematococcus lacustris]|nr:hypothetical protein QJQ45_020641 [Haematococcus lacustris]